jgi:hypothetical protein
MDELYQTDGSLRVKRNGSSDKMIAASKKVVSEHIGVSTTKGCFLLPSNSQEQKVYNNGQDLDCGLMGLDKAGG